MKTIPLSAGKVALVDDEDFEFLNQWKWTFMGGYAKRYPMARGKRVLVSMHRLLLNPDATREVDHIDGDGTNNQKSNLRLCQHKENCRNQRLVCDSTTGCKGVDFHKQSGKFRARITRFYKVKHLGYFEKLEQARSAYDAAARELHRQFARPNNV